MRNASIVGLLGLGLGIFSGGTARAAEAPLHPPSAEEAKVPSGAKPAASVDESGPRERKFDDVPVAEVLRTLARQARVNLVLSDYVAKDPTKISMRLSEVTAFDALQAVCFSQGFVFEKKESIYYVKHPRERLAEMQFLDSEYLAQAQAEFRARQMKELVAGGLKRTEAMELLKADVIRPAKLRSRGAPPRESRSDFAGEPPPPKGVRKTRAKMQEFEGAGLAKVLEQLAADASLSVLLSQGVRDLDATVTVRLEDVSAWTAFHIVCQAKNLIVRTEGKVLLVQLPAEKMADRHYLDDEGLAQALGRYRSNLVKELKARGFSAAEAVTLAKVDEFSAEQLAK